MDTKEVHPADKFGLPNGGKDPAKVPITSILRRLDSELSRPAPTDAEEALGVRDLERYGMRPPLRADNRLEEISRLLLSLPFGEMLKLAEEMVKSAPPLEEGKAELPDHIRMAMSLDVWAKAKMEERDAFVRETPTTK